MSTYRGSGSPIAGDITTVSLEDLNDVKDNLGPTDGQVLTYDTTNGWQAETSPIGVTDHTLLSNIGSNTHATIDTHLANTSNPHSVDSNDVGAGSAFWNANKLQGKELDSTVGTPSDGDILVFRSAGNDWILEVKPSGGGGISNVVEDTTPQLGGNLDAQGNRLDEVGEIRGTLGSAGSPGYTFQNDQNTGMYRGATDTLNFSTNSTERLEIESNGTLNVSGTTNYETLVTNDDDIPNKKFVDDHNWLESDITDLGTYETADATILKEADVDDVAVNGVTTAPISSNWAFDHENNTSNPHSVSASDVGNTTAQWNSDSLRGSSLDTTVATPSDGDILVFRSAGTDWVLEAKPAGGSNPALNDVTDVTITSTVDNELLAYDNGTSEWINQTPSEAGVATASHTHTESDITDLQSYLLDLTGSSASTLSDVTITAIATNEILKWNGTAFINNTLAEAGIEAADSTIIKEADVDDTPVNGVTTAPVSSNWAFDHESNVSNPHTVTATQVGAASAFWNANKLQGTDLDSAVGSPSDGDILVYRSAGTDWVLEAKPAGGSNPAISDITDITITSVADNEVLAFDNGTSEWINQTPGEAGLAASSHTHTESDITDLGNYAASSHNHSAADLTSGSIPDARVTEGNVTQHRDAVVELSINTQTGTTYTLVLGDAGDVVEMNNASANTLTVPPNSSVAFPIGSVVNVTQLGAGATTIAQGSGVTIRTAETLILNQQYAVSSLYKRGTNEWVLTGYLTEA